MWRNAKRVMLLMTRTKRHAITGAVIGATLGIVRSLLDNSAGANPYLEQTEMGRVAEYIGYLIPWTAIGALIGSLNGHRTSGPTTVVPTSQEAMPALQTTVLQRLGHVLGRTGNLTAVPLIALGVYGFTQPGGDAFVKSLAIAAGIVAFLIGRALRYIFAGTVR